MKLNSKHAPSPGGTDRARLDDVERRLAYTEPPEVTQFWADVRAEVARTQPPPVPDERATGLSIIPANQLPPEPISWLWDGWLPRGKVDVLAGAPGTGKTSLAMALAATLTTGGRWPDGSAAPVGSVLIWSGEDDPRDTLVPRLLACGADLSRVSFVGSVLEAEGNRSFDPARDAELLRDRAAAMDPPPALLIVDPIVSAVSGDSHKNAEVRRALQPLVDLATTVRCVVLGISHFTKGTAGRDPVERVTGSLAFGALARVVLATAKRSKEDGGGRMLARAKNNLGPDSGGFAYDLEPVELSDHPGVLTTRVVWGPPLEGTARELLSMAEQSDDPGERNALEDAMEWLRDTLELGPLDGKEIKRLSRAEGIAERTLYRAADALGVDRRTQGFGKTRLWSMCAKPPMCASEKGLADIGTHGDLGTHEPMSANVCQTQNLGTHGDLGTHGGETGPCVEEF